MATAKIADSPLARIRALFNVQQADEPSNAQAAGLEAKLVVSWQQPPKRPPHARRQRAAKIAAAHAAIISKVAATLAAIARRARFGLQPSR